MALHQQLVDKGASDAVFDRLEALFDQLANPKSDSSLLLQAIQAFQAELAAAPSAGEVSKPVTPTETPLQIRFGTPPHSILKTGLVFLDLSLQRFQWQQKYRLMKQPANQIKQKQTPHTPLTQKKTPQTPLPLNNKKRGWDKSPSLSIILDCRARRSG